MSFPNMSQMKTSDEKWKVSILVLVDVLPELFWIVFSNAIKKVSILVLVDVLPEQNQRKRKNRKVLLFQSLF